MDSFQRTGEILLQRGLLSQAQLDQALDAQTRTDLRFGEVAVVLGFVEESAITECLSQQFDLPVADLDVLEPEEDAVTLIPAYYAITNLILPISLRDNALHAVIADPLDFRMIDEVTTKTGHKLQLWLASPRKLSAAIARTYQLPTLRTA